jgi:hypothetical protein
MLRISKTREVWWPAVVHEPQDGGKTLEQKLEVRIHVPHAQEPPQSDREFVENHVVDWRGVDGEALPFATDAGDPMPFSKENLSAVLDLAYVRLGIGAAIADCSRGIAAKN